MEEEKFSACMPHQTRRRISELFYTTPANIIEAAIHKHVGSLQSLDMVHSLFNESTITGEHLLAWRPAMHKAWGGFTHMDDRGYWLLPDNIQRGMCRSYSQHLKGKLITSTGDIDTRSFEQMMGTFHQGFTTMIAKQDIGRFFEYRLEPTSNSTQPQHTSVAIYDVAKMYTLFGNAPPAETVAVVCLVSKNNLVPGATLDQLFGRIKSREQSFGQRP